MDGLTGDGGNAFDQDHGSTCGFDVLGSLDELNGSFQRLALGLVAAQLGCELRSQADVADDDHAGVVDGGDPLEAGLGVAFELDGVHRSFLDESARVVDRVLVGHLIAHEGHVADAERVRSASVDSLRVGDHLVHGDGPGVSVAVHDVAGGVADQDHLDACSLFVFRGQIVITGQPGDLFACGLHVSEINDRLFLDVCHFYYLSEFYNKQGY